MSVQLLFCVECKKQCKSDEMYVNYIVKEFYPDLMSSGKIKLQYIYMDGKGNYQSPKVQKEIGKYIQMFSGETKVIYVIDTDKINTDRYIRQEKSVPLAMKIVDHFC